jgi:hypothetical protein
LFSSAKAKGEAANAATAINVIIFLMSILHSN